MKPFRSLRRAASLALAAATLALLASSCATSNKYGCPSSLNHGGGGRYSSR